jgi:hypothetical protein
MLPKAAVMRWRLMTDTIDDLQRQMDAAASALDFEEARRIRDRINLMRGGASVAEVEQADTSGLVRQQPGAMGLGTSRQRPIPPPGWKPPSKPDLMTSGRKRTRETTPKVPPR